MEERRREMRNPKALQCEFPYFVKDSDRFIEFSEYLKSGGFANTYVGYFHYPTGNLNALDHRQVAIKEYFMDKIGGDDVCFRYKDGKTVCVNEKYKECFDRYKNKFIEEVQALATLQDHENIVKIHHFFMNNATVYYVMDYIPGVNLAEMIQRFGPLDLLNAWKFVIRPICCALRDAVHSQNIVHTDISPANIMLEPLEGNGVRPVLLDFGLCRTLDEKGTVMVSGIGAGTECFSAIEVLNPKEYDWKLDQRADIYSIGAVLYFVVKGKRPLLGLDRLNADGHEQLQAILDKTTRLKREDRFSSMAELIEFCDELLLSDDGKTQIRDRSQDERTIQNIGVTVGSVCDEKKKTEKQIPPTEIKISSRGTVVLPSGGTIDKIGTSSGNSGNGGTGGAGTPPPVKEKTWLEKYGFRLLIAVVLAALLALVPEVLNNQQEPPVVDPIPPVGVPEDPNKQLKEDLNKLFTEVRNGEIGENTVLDLFEEDAYFVVIAGDQEIGGPADLSHQIEHLLLPASHYKVGQDYRVKEIYRNDQTGKFTSIEIEKIK